ncbi:MAG: hypothetical protein ACR2PU_01775 [Gammaproteobacteria bacterium]
MNFENKFGMHRLLDAEDNFESSMGGSFPGERAVFRGRDVFGDFKNWSWIRMLFFCVVGREPTVEAEKFLNGLYCMCFNYADPRIWNNRVAALAASASSTAQLGVCSASAVSEAVIYGGPPVSQALKFLISAKCKYDSGESLKNIIEIELEKNGVVFGFGRPINKIDERIKPALDLLKELNLFDRSYVQFAVKIQEVLLSSRNQIGFNIGGVMAAFCADEDLSATELYQLMIVCFYVGQLACYIESDSKPTGSFLPLRCSRVTYEGVGMRKW